MNFNADHYFAIGHMHTTAGKPCQDHALSTVTPGGIACAVIADGCSSGGNTDIGARALTLATIAAAREAGGVTFNLATTVAQRAWLAQAKNMFSLQPDDLLATCAFTMVSDEGVLINVQGDGAWAVKRRDGSIVATKLEWAANMPYYPAYAVNGEDRMFVAMHGALSLMTNPSVRDDLRDSCASLLKNRNLKLIPGDHLSLIERTGSAASTLTEHRVHIGPDRSRGEEHVFPHSTAEGMDGMAVRYSDPSMIEVVAVFSDGVTQVEGMSWVDVVERFLDVKVGNGEFVKRCMMWGIKNMKKTGKGPMDDVSGAMVRLS